MNCKLLSGILVSLLFCMSDFAEAGTKTGKFDVSRDLFIAQFDSKTDVDDLHAMAAISALLKAMPENTPQYHAVTGTYGIQEGLYVPPGEVFSRAFDFRSDAHNARGEAVEKVLQLVKKTLLSDGQIWVVEAGQSDFTYLWLKELKIALPKSDIASKVHIVQHSDWNEQTTSPEALSFVKQHADYQKIPDGNKSGNGSPNFTSDNKDVWKKADALSPAADLWRVARNQANKFNGQDGRYNNAVISAGGMDFSDTVEACWILGCSDINNVGEFFDFVSQNN